MDSLLCGWAADGVGATVGRPVDATFWDAAEDDDTASDSPPPAEEGQWGEDEPVVID